MLSRYVVGITGASGSIYAARVIEELIKLGNEVFLVASSNGKKVFEYELEINFEEWIKETNRGIGTLVLCDENDMFSSIASGSFKTEGMIIVPCSMGTLAKISNGISDNLLIRAADVTIKEKRRLIVVPRETPLSPIHLENMLSLSRLSNVTIVPPMPAFYNKPQTIDDIISGTVGRVLESVGLNNSLYKEWNGKK